MVTRAEIKQKLQTALALKIYEVKEARINYVVKNNLEITDVIILEPKVILPETIDKDDFEKAEEIAFVRAQIRLCIDSMNLVYYCNGNAIIKYRDNDFDIDLRITNIYSN